LLRIDLFRGRRRAARDAEPPAGAEAALDRLRGVVAHRLDQLVVAVGEGRDDDLALRRAAVAAGARTNAAAEQAAHDVEVHVLGAALRGRELHAGTVVDHHQGGRGLVGLDATGDGAEHAEAARNAAERAAHATGVLRELDARAHGVVG